MYKLSGKFKERANEKYGIGYGFFWVAHNSMLAYLKTRKRRMRYRTFGNIEDEMMAAKIHSSKRELIL